MKKDQKNKFTKISSRIWIIVFCIMIVLVLKTGLWDTTTHPEIQYGPYSCGENILSINVKESKNHLQITKHQEIHFVWNNRQIRTTENYNAEGVEDFTELPWKTRCTPLIINEPLVARELADCIRQKMEDGTIEQERKKQNGLPFEICGIGYSNPERQYE